MDVLKNNTADVDITQLQFSPSDRLMKSQDRRSMAFDERQYLDKLSKERALHWLYKRHIVFNLLPEPSRVKQIAFNPSERIQALGALDYLEQEPDHENVGMLSALLTVLGLAIGLLFEELPWPDGPWKPLAVNIAIIAFITMMFIMLALVRKNARIRRLGAWATTWSTAIREYGDSNFSSSDSGSSQKKNVNTSDTALPTEKPDPRQLDKPSKIPNPKPGLIAVLAQWLTQPLREIKGRTNHK